MIFNSLGSNYNLGFVIKSTFSFPKREEEKKLIYSLEKKYNGKAILLYKGREAINIALRISNLPKGSKVAVNGFTCFVVYQAIINAGYVPVYIDIDRGSLNSNIKLLEEKIKKDKEIKALIIQNTLGNPVDITSVKRICSLHKLILIEDLAHSIGSFYPNGKETGTEGNFVALSFSQDKSVDAVSGGALIVRDDKYVPLLMNINLRQPMLGKQIRDRFYPLFTLLIRKLYPVGVGKMIHFIFKKFKLLSNPLGEINRFECFSLPLWYIRLVRMGFMKHGEEYKHREMIANIYLQNLGSKLVPVDFRKNYQKIYFIRFPIITKNRLSLMRFLRNKGIFISDTWYDSVVAPKKLTGMTNYDGSCPVSENVSDMIVNLPTHSGVSLGDAEKICRYIKEWQDTNQN